MDPVSTHVIAHARSVRIAFFIPADASSHPILDAAVDAAVSLWGGRFSLMVPCIDGTPMNAFRPWLAAFDPDLIYAYVELTEGHEAELHEWLYPSEIRVHSQAVDDPRQIPLLPFTPLSVTSVLPALRAGGRTVPSGPPFVVELDPQSRTDPFLRQNFSSPLALQAAIRRSLAPYGIPLVALPDGEATPTLGRRGAPDPATSGAVALLHALATNPSATTASQLAASLCQRWSLPHHAWQSSFNLVIGDTVEDRLMFWNSRFLTSAWRDGDDVDLYVPTSRMADAEFLAALAAFLKSRNYVGNSQDGGLYRVTLRSISLEAETLTSFAEAIASLLPGQHVSIDRIDSLEALAKLVPALSSISRAGATSGGHDLFPNAPSLHVVPPGPDHLRFAPPELKTLQSGLWAVDLDIARTLDHSPYQNVQDRWRLPRRLRVTQAFRLPYALEHHGSMLTPRVERSGLLTLFAGSDRPLPPVSIPTDIGAIRTALTRGRDWTSAHQRTKPYIPPQLCYDAKPSDAGQHFYGVIQLLGSLDAANNLLLHRFWRAQLDRFGATDQRSQNRHPEVLRRVEKRLGSVSLDLAREDHRHTLANLILLEADAERMTVPSLSWSDLVRDFMPIVEEHTLSDGPERERVQESYLLELRRCVERFCASGILHQGYELRCRKCLHRNWISVEALAVSIPCHVCQRPMPAPLEQPWQFRLNGFLREALQRHGIGPLFWVLNRYRRNDSGSFWFQGPMNIYFDEASANAQRPDTDIDLIMVDNGKVILCEAKQSERSFTKPLELAQAMKRLRPDIALVAVMEPLSPKLSRRFETFADALEGTGIVPQLITLDDRKDLENTPWFLD